MLSIEGVLQSYINRINRVAIHLDNSEHWLTIDSVLTELGTVIIPIPHFFSKQQILHMINATGVDVVICESHAKLMWQAHGFETSPKDNPFFILMTRYVKAMPILPANTHKITFTSGTTSEPKGVCLSKHQLQTVALSLAVVTSKLKVKKHLCLLPLSILLENMAANYAAKETNISVITPSLTEIGLSGSSNLNVKKLVETIIRYKPDSIILMPQMLKAIMLFLEKLMASNKAMDLSFLKFIAVGGAVCSKGLLLKAQLLKLPVYEGYGISECGSVISLNTNPNNIGSVGRVLPHQKIKINPDNEIMVSGHLFLGYIGQAEINGDKWYATGDLGSFDSNDNLTIIGRKKNIIINSYGRNISPEWLEAELSSLKDIYQCIVYGESKPYLTAICVTTAEKYKLWKKIEKLNQSLPDYAQVKRIITSQQTFTVKNKMLNASGTLNSQQIFLHFKQQLKAIYANT